MKTLIIIPSRMSAKRLPGKPLLKINGVSIISHVYKKAVKANIGEVFVATEDQKIVDDVKYNGGQAILTSNHHETGTDRIYEALEKANQKNIDLVMNLQGDEPMIDPADLINLNNQMIKNKSKMGTIASNISETRIYENKNFVKVTTKETLDNLNFPEAISFSRKLKINTKNSYHHVGIYCYHFETLKDFVNFKQSGNELKNKLEQLRALDNNVKINVALTNSPPIGVDTMEDYVAIKKLMEYKSS